LVREGESVHERGWIGAHLEAAGVTLPPVIRFALLLALLTLSACAVTPRLPLDVVTAVARDDMRLVRSETVDLYYPAHLKPQAYALLSRAEGCVERLRAAATGRGGLWRDRVEIIFADLPFNNAFVKPPSEGDFFSVIPSYWNLDIGTELGVPLAPDYVACHEITHYIHSQQTLRSLGGVNKAFGYLVTPQIGLDAWFAEGLATYYEQVLSPGTGRPAWPVWEGMFHAAVAEHRITGGHFNALRRQIHWGNHYLYGSHFVAYLVNTYGEEKLWRLIERQGKSFFFPFTVNQRFKKVYGKTLSHLLDDFAAFAAYKYPAQARPTNQNVVRDVGMDGRYARALDGSEAVVSDAMDAPPRLTVYTADGSVRYRRLLTDVLPQRYLVSPSAVGISGLRFSRDSRRLYFVAVDLGAVFQKSRLFELDLTSKTLRKVSDELDGLGGDVSPDGREYLFVRSQGKGHALFTIDLATGNMRELFRAPMGVYLASPTYSPDGSTILASAFEGAYAFYLFDAKTGAHTGTLSAAGKPVSDPSWMDDQRIMFLGEQDRRFQAFSYDRTTHATTQLTHAPYVVLQPRFWNNTVRFLNRVDSRYSLDEVRLGKVSADARGLTVHGSFLADAHELFMLERALPSQAAPAPPAPAESAPSAPPAAAPLPAPEGAAPPTEGSAIDLTEHVLSEENPATPEPEAAASDAQPPPESVPELPGRLVLSPPTLTLQEGPSPPLPPKANRPLHEVQDTRYRSFPRILIPSIRAPILALGVSDTGLPIGSIGFHLGGTDALGFHRWGLSASLQPSPLLFSGSIGYLNAQLAPFLWMLSASQLDYDYQKVHKRDADADGEKDDIYYSHRRERQRDAQLLGFVQLRTTALGGAVHFTENYEPDNPTLTDKTRSLGGGTLLLHHVALESTPMSGPRRGYTLDLSGSYYPGTLGTLGFDITDVGGGLGLYSPLPFSRRHTLSLALRGRGILHHGPDQLLEVGGNPGGVLFDQPERRDALYYPGLPPTRRFAEPLRGYETYPFNANQIGIVDVRYRYPWIFDAGTATSLSILPAFFLRQLDFELFATGAAESTNLSKTGHATAGGALGVQMVWLVPILVRYQVSKRFTDDEAWQHLITIAPVLQP
jgi:hypothetical protein